MSLKLILRVFLGILVQKSPKGYHVVLKGQKYSFIKEYLNKLFPMLADKQYTVGTKIYWLLHDLHDFPRCKRHECERILTRNALITTGYGAGYCSI